MNKIIKAVSLIVLIVSAALGFIWLMMRMPEVKIRQKTMQRCVQKLGEEVYRCKNLPIIWEE